MIGLLSQFIPPPYLDWFKVGHLPRWVVRCKEVLAWFSGSSEALSGQGEYGYGSQNLCSLFLLPSQHWALREVGAEGTSGRLNLIKPPEPVCTQFSAPRRHKPLPICIESPEKDQITKRRTSLADCVCDALLLTTSLVPEI